MKILVLIMTMTPVILARWWWW